MESTTTRWNDPGTRGDAGAGYARSLIPGLVRGGDGFHPVGVAFEARGERSFGDGNVDDIRPYISGRVLNAAGFPLAGVAVEARGERLFDELAQTGFMNEGFTYTDGDGFYAFTELVEGRYRISTEEEGFRPARIRARTGTETADLVLHAEQVVWLYGRLTSQGRKALAGAEVTVNLSPPVSVRTDAQGRYEIGVALQEDAAHLDVRFKHPAYVAESRRLDEEYWTQTGEVELNVALEPIAETTTVVGRLESNGGEPVRGETLTLYSPSLMRRSQGVSAGDGTFRIPDVAVAPDYIASVRPRGPYQDLTMRGVRITADTELQVPLEPLESGVLTGRMMDVYGNPVSNFTLSVEGKSAPSRRLEVTGDKHGKFTTAEVPFDRLVFQTHSYPLFRISDVRLEPWADEVAIVLDLGPYAVRGRLLDEAGFPLAASQVYLSWSHKEGSARSTAIRQTVTDVDGHFRFAGLGAGLHTISVNIPGQGSARLEKDVSAEEDEVLVQLEPRAL